MNDTLMTYYQSADLARLTGLTAATIRGDVRRGELAPAARTISGAALFDETTARAWIERRRDRRKRGA